MLMPQTSQLCMYASTLRTFTLPSFGEHFVHHVCKPGGTLIGISEAVIKPSSLIVNGFDWQMLYLETDKHFLSTRNANDMRSWCHGRDSDRGRT